MRAGSPVYVRGDFKALDESPIAQQLVGLTRFAKQVFDLKTRAIKNVKDLLDVNRDGHVSHKEALESYSGGAKLAQTKAKDLSEEIEFSVFGIFSSSTTHSLFIADGFEADLVNRLRNALMYKFVGGALAMTFGVLLLIGGPFMEQLNGAIKTAKQFAVVQRVRALERPKTSPTELHHQCVQKMKIACKELLVRQVEFGLSESYVKYYSDQMGMD